MLLLLFSLALTARRLVHPARLSAGVRRLVLRRLDQRHVHADADRPSRLAAGVPRARRSPGIADPKRARGGAVLGLGDGAVAGDRARAADLSRARRRRRWCCSGSPTATSASGCAAYAVGARRRDRARPSCCSPPTPTALRCATPCRRCGCPTRCSAGPCCSGWRCWSPARLAAAAGAGRRRPALIIAAFHALLWPHCLQRLEGVSPEVERIVAEPCPRGAADLPPRLADRVADRRAAGDRADRLGAAGLARRATTATGCGGCLAAAAAGAVAATACCCGRRAPARRRRCWRCPARRRSVWLLVPLALALAHRAGAGARHGAAWCSSALGALVPLVARLHSRRSQSTERDRAIGKRQPTVHVAVGAAADRPAAQGHGVHLRRPRPAADHRHPPRCGHRPLSPQRRADRRRHERLPRQRRPGARDRSPNIAPIIC